MTKSPSEYKTLEPIGFLHLSDHLHLDASALLDNDINISESMTIVAIMFGHVMEDCNKGCDVVALSINGDSVVDHLAINCNKAFVDAINANKAFVDSDEASILAHNSATGGAYNIVNTSES
jgi:hypothetical protein